LQKKVPRVIILDLILPDISCTEPIKTIKADFPAVKIIVFTGNTPDELLIQSLQAGVSGILLKNSSQAEIVKAIKSVTTGKNI
jgi:DNA-binding NarL/FixJ family response regulator